MHGLMHAGGGQRSHQRPRAEGASRHRASKGGFLCPRHRTAVDAAADLLAERRALLATGARVEADHRLRGWDGATGVTCRTHCCRSRAGPGNRPRCGTLGLMRCITDMLTASGTARRCRTARLSWTFLGRFLPELGGAVRRRPSFAPAGDAWRAVLPRPARSGQRGRPAAVAA
jgi:hypothetical protein